MCPLLICPPAALFVKISHRKMVAELIDAQKAAQVDLLRTEVRLADIEQQLIRERNALRIQSFLLNSFLGVSGHSGVLNTSHL